MSRGDAARLRRVLPNTGGEPNRALSQWLFNVPVDWDDAERLATRWTLSPSQLAVVVEWRDEFLLTDAYRTSDEAERVERWRSLKSEAHPR